MESPGAFIHAVDQMCLSIGTKSFDKILCAESRGFILGAPLAFHTGKGLALARKPGKLPRRFRTETYSLEYGLDCLQMHEDSIKPRERVVIVDDVLATGGTARALTKLVENSSATVVCCVFLIELQALKGRDLLKGYDVKSLVSYA